jgi:transposase
LRQEREVWGAQRTVLVVFSPNFYRQQHKTMLIQLDQASRKLKALQDRLAAWENGLWRKGRRPALESVKRQVAEILSGQHLKELMVVTIELRGQFVHLEYRVDETRLAELAERVFGKCLLFSDQRNWTDETLVGSYWDKWEIEAAFRQMKNRRHCGWFPMYHWTDQKIRVHAFYCLLALLISSVLQQKARQAAITVGAEELMTMLSGIHQVAYRYGRSKQEKPKTTLSDRDEDQQKLTDELGLMKYA